MNKITISIPSGFKYLSEVKDEAGNKFQLPNGILNKEITGCGGTTLALEDENRTIICSPRIKLLENKAEQYKNSLLVIQGVNKEQIKQYLEAETVPKILTTYDSFSKVKKVVGDLSEWKIVVDEFQCLLNDSSFKADTEIAFLKELQSCPYVTYLSATPILDKYISQIDFFKDKTYFQLNWADKEKVFIRRIKTANPIGGAITVINNYKRGLYPTLDDGIKIESKEAVIFLNSVTDTLNIIKHTGRSLMQINQESSVSLSFIRLEVFSCQRISHFQFNFRMRNLMYLAKLYKAMTEASTIHHQHLIGRSKAVHNHRFH